jgi:hypothetical protein
MNVLYHTSVFFSVISVASVVNVFAGFPFGNCLLGKAKSLNHRGRKGTQGKPHREVRRFIKPLCVPPCETQGPLW